MRHGNMIQSATPGEGMKRRWINPMKAVRTPEKHSGGDSGGRKVIHGHHKRSATIKVGEKILQQTNIAKWQHCPQYY
jgi:hypothetical protein